MSIDNAELQKIKNAGTTAFNNIAKVLTKIRQAGNTHSLIEFTQATNINPLVIIDVDCSNSEHISHMLSTVHRIYAGYFLQAVSLMNANVNGINILKMLRPLDPKVKFDWRSFENFKIPSIEGDKQDKEEKQSEGYKLSGDVTKSLNEDANLCTGMMYSVTISDEVKDSQGKVISNKTATVPINIRLVVKTLPNSVMVNVLGHTPLSESTFSDFYHDWRAGLISFKDMIIQKSLVDRHFKTLIEDKTGTYSNIIKDKNAKTSFNILTALVNEKPSYNTASNVAVVSSDTIKQVINQIKGSSIREKKVRSLIFDNSNLMFLMVFDKGTNVVKVFYRGLDDYNELSINDLKRISDSKDSSSVMDIMKQLLNGNTPSY